MAKVALHLLIAPPSIATLPANSLWGMSYTPPTWLSEGYTMAIGSLEEEVSPGYIHDLHQSTRCSDRTTVIQGGGWRWDCSAHAALQTIKTWVTTEQSSTRQPLYVSFCAFAQPAQPRQWLPLTSSIDSGHVGSVDPNCRSAEDETCADEIIK